MVEHCTGGSWSGPIELPQTHVTGSVNQPSSPVEEVSGTVMFNQRVHRKRDQGHTREEMESFNIIIKDFLTFNPITRVLLYISGSFVFY